jgi:transglycosylase-like protein with SLT domain
VLAEMPKLSLSLAAAALLGSGLGTTSHATVAAAPTPDSTAAVSSANSGPAPAAPNAPASATCLAQTICAVKERIRWQTPAWTPSQCRRIADAVNDSAKRHDLSPTLLLAIMVNESDMNEKSARAYTRDGKIYAKDGGLMAIRCLLDDKERCTNGNVRGVAWKDLMDPVKNIELGARELAHWRDGGGVARTTIVKLDSDGHRQQVSKIVPCQHKTHAWWAHYNHGPLYHDKGYARHYPHRIAVLDHAFATVMNTPAPELEAGRITIRDVGKRERTPDRPLEPRFKKLCEQILSSGTCSALALN